VRALEIRNVGRVAYTPAMNGLEPLINLAGAWKSTYKLFLSPTHPAQESASRASVRSIAAGRFVQIDYTWAHEGKPHAGSIIIGHQAKDALVTAHWVDSFHNSDKVMACTGSAKPGGAIDVYGTYEAPPGPNWGWRTTIEPRGRSSFRMRMYNISPEGQEDLAVDASYVRSKVAAPRKPSARGKRRTRSRARRRS
jgi:hypothetical protein